MRPRVLGLVLVVAVSFAGAAWAGGARGQRRTSARATPHRVTIRPARRSVALGARAKNLPFLRSLAGKRDRIHRGVEIYRNVRWRLRELHSRLGERMTMRPLAKIDSFILDRVDFHSRKPGTKLKVLVVGGVHAGSEPVGVEAALRVAEDLASRPEVLDHFDVTVVPLVNPSGLTRTASTRSDKGTLGRKNVHGHDINRSFSAGSWTPEATAVAELIARERFDVVLDLHGAGSFRTGFFMIRGRDDGGMAARIMGDLAAVPALDARGAGTTYRLDAPGVVTSSNAGTLKQFAALHGARYSYTIEAPNRFAPEDQVEGTLAIVRSTLRHLAPTGQRF